MQISILIIIAAALAAVVSSQQQVYSENKTQHNGRMVLLGGLFPISENKENECHGLRTSAVEALEAMVFTIHKINSNRTLLPNVNLTFDIRDTCSIPNKALERSLSYMQAPAGTSQNTNETLAVSGIVGAGFFSLVSMAVASLFRLFQIPQISYGSSASELSNRVRFDYFFRTLPSDAFLARAMADVVNYYNWSYILALHSDDTFGTSGLEVILENIVKQNTSRKCVAIQISLPNVGSEDDYDEIVARMNQPWVRNASIALLYGYKRQANGIMKAITKLMQKEPDTPLKDLTWVGCNALLVDEQYRHLVKGMLRMEYKVNKSSEFQRHFTAMTPQSASINPHFQSYWEHKFNCSTSGENGLQECTNFNLANYNQRNEISSIIDAVYSFAYAIHGLIEEHCPNHTLCSEIMVHRSAGMAVNGTMIRDYLLHNLSFPGLSAEMTQFDSAGNDQSSYVVKSLHRTSNGRYEYVPVGTWDPQTLLNFNADIQWNNHDEIPESVCSHPCENGSFKDYVREHDCCWSCSLCVGVNSMSTGEVCSECPVGYSPNELRSGCAENVVSYLTWRNPWAIVIIIATSLGIITTLSFAVIFIVFNKHKIIKASSRELSAILLTGLVMCYILPFLFLTKPSVATCTLRRFFVGLSFTVCFSALLVKTNRIHRIFNKSPEQLKKKPRFISPHSQIIISSILISVQILIAVLWLAIEHPSITYAYASKITDLKCGESSEVGLIVTLGYNLLLLILSTYFAFLARRIPENFNEAKFINITLYTIIIIWLAFIPTYLATAKLGSAYQTSSLVIAIILSASTTLCCLFVPKVFLLISEFVKDKIGSTPTVTDEFTKSTRINGTTKSIEKSGV